MTLKLIGKMSLVASLLAVSSVSFADTTDPITCPSISSIQQSANKLDSVYQYDKSAYFVYTSQIAFNENTKDWQVGAAVITKKAKDALKTAQKNVKTVNQQQNKIAEISEGGTIAVCKYGTFKDILAFASLKPIDTLHSIMPHVKAHE